jgi:hypothetical protein
MDIEGAKKMYRLEAGPAREAARTALGVVAAAEVRPPVLSFGQRYDDISAQLEALATFEKAAPADDSSASPWERTPLVWMAWVRDKAGAPSKIGLRFVRMRSTASDTPTSIAAHWYSAPDQETGTDQVEGPFAVEYVTALEAGDADMGLKPIQESGDDPRPLEQRMALLEQSLAEYLDVQGAVAA